MNKSDQIILALDTPDFSICRKWVSSLKGLIRFFKVGSELFTSVGADAVRYILDQGADVFLDLKFHDIPTTVAHSAKAAAALGVRMFNVHALGGVRMMRAAKEAVESSDKRPSIVGVTILTSLSPQELASELRIKPPLKNQVLHLAKLCQRAGLDGVVASAQEISLIKKALGKDFKVVTPGIRPLWSVKGDQSRVVTPEQAFRLGADHVVIGRPITGASDPKEAACRIIEEIES